VSKINVIKAAVANIIGARVRYLDSKTFAMFQEHRMPDVDEFIVVEVGEGNETKQVDIITRDSRYWVGQMFGEKNHRYGQRVNAAGPGSIAELADTIEDCLERARTRAKIWNDLIEAQNAIPTN
jgi:hypothetical protein